MGDIGLNSFGDFTNTSFFAGLRHAITSAPTLQPFVQAGAGLIHLSADCPGCSATECPECHETSFSFAAGGGVRYAISPKLSAVAELDLARATFESFAHNGFRLLLGAAFELGKQEPAPTTQAAKVVGANQAFARHFFGTVNPVGREVEASVGQRSEAFAVVGVVSDAVYRSQRSGVAPTPPVRDSATIRSPIDEAVCPAPKRAAGST